MQLSRYKNKSVAVFGLGKTGLSVINALIKSGTKIYAWDDNEEQISNAKMIYRNCSFIHPKEYNWHKIKTLILSPGVPILYPNPHWIVKLAKRYGCKIKSDIELFFEIKATNQKIIGVTGTNGKSTTVSLIGHILKSEKKKVAVGGNLGIPILNLEDDAEIYVIEFSSFQLELIGITTFILASDTGAYGFFSGSNNNNSIIKNVTETTKIDIAVLLNITPDHIDRHGSMANYISTKLKLINGSKVAVIGCDNEITFDIFNKFTGNKIPISAYTLPFLSSECSSAKIKSYKYNMSDIKINLMSNAENISAAYAVCKLLKIDNNAIISGIESFLGLKHRNELLGKIENILFVNDSKATNAKSSEKAILSYKNVYWIVGGKSKEGGIEPLGKYFTRIRKAFSIGESTEAFADHLIEKGVDCIKCYNLENAFQLSFEDAINSKEEVTILLSPACSSFDQWKNFEERGDAFHRMFKDLMYNYVYHTI